MQGMSSQTDLETDAGLERRLDEALGQPPAVEIPADFAARMAMLAPVHQQPVSVSRSVYGRGAIVLCLVALLAALVILAPRATGGSTLMIAIEWILCAQLSLLALFVAVPRRSLHAAF